MKKTEKPWGKTHLLQIIDVSSCSDDFECIPSKVETTSSVLRQWAIKTRPLSNCVLRASAYQRARQRNIGIAKKSYQGFWRLFGKGRMFGRPFFKTNPEELSTLCIYPKQLLNNTKNVSIKKKTLSITNLAQCFYPATLEEHPINNYDLDRVALAQHLLYHSKGEMLRREQSKGHRKGTRAWQKDIQSLWSKSFLLIWGR